MVQPFFFLIKILWYKVSIINLKASSHLNLGGSHSDHVGIRQWVIIEPNNSCLLLCNCFHIQVNDRISSFSPQREGASPNWSSHNTVVLSLSKSYSTKGYSYKLLIHYISKCCFANWFSPCILMTFKQDYQCNIIIAFVLLSC